MKCSFDLSYFFSKVSPKPYVIYIVLNKSLEGTNSSFTCNGEFPFRYLKAFVAMRCSTLSYMRCSTLSYDGSQLFLTNLTGATSVVLIQNLFFERGSFCSSEFAEFEKNLQKGGCSILF